MSQSSVVEELKAAGVPVRQGEVQSGHGPLPKGKVSEIGSRVWLKTWAKHAAMNYPVISRAKGVRFLVNSCHGMNAIVCGIGPSLDKDIQALKDAAGKALLIATDAAYRPLVAAGIRPDLVISYDCKPQQKLLWEGVPSQNTPCLFNSCSHPDAIASWKGPVLFYNAWHQTDELSHELLPVIYPEIGQLPSAATVGNMAVLLTKLLGCPRAICVGMDFCYQNDRYRAKDYRLVDAPDHVTGKRWEETEIKPLYDNAERLARTFAAETNGKPYRVDPELDAYFDSFVNLTKHFKVEVVNTAAYGRLASVIPTMPLADAVKEFCTETLFGGRCVLPYLDVIVKDPRLCESKA